MKQVTVIIPTYKPGEKFVELIDRLKEQTYPIEQMIIVNTGIENWCEREIPGAEVFHITAKEFDHGGTRRRCMEMAKTPYVICMTQDAIPKDRFLIEQLVKAVESEQVAVAYARQLADEESSIIEKLGREYNYPEQERLKSAEDLPELGIKTFFCSNVCAIYKKDIYEKLGGFVRRTIFNEDMIFAAGVIKAGYSIAYASKAEVIHSHDYGYKEQFQRNFDLGVSQAQHPEVFSGIISEGEGMRMVRRTTHELLSQKQGWQLGRFYGMSAAKLIGYRLGKMYRSLPLWMIKLCSSSKGYWTSN